MTTFVHLIEFILSFCAISIFVYMYSVIGKFFCEGSIIDIFHKLKKKDDKDEEIQD